MSASSQLSWRPTFDPTYISPLSSYDPSRSRAASPSTHSPAKIRPSRVAPAVPGSVVSQAAAGSASQSPFPSLDAPPIIFKQPVLPVLNEHPDMPSNPSLTMPPPTMSHPSPTVVPMTPSSSLGLPSPTFPPRRLPALPPRSPARPRTGSSAALSSAPSSRRNSWQVSVRLASSRAQQHASAFPALNEDILSPGDLIGEGVELQGEIIQPVHVPSSPRDLCQLPSAKFEVIRKLGTGSYAVVFLVREVFGADHLTPECADELQFADPDFGSTPTPTPGKKYGRPFAIKCLSKANLSPQELEVQMFEATIHQSLDVHPNIVTLHRTLETASFLLLVLEYVPGEDLFYFLEQSRDNSDEFGNDDLSSGGDRNPNSTSSISITNTPPTPSLLSSVHPSQLLSHGRLRLIASMFAQMCDAVQACHAQGVSHRDIKPENFIVTDGQVRGPDGKLERRVIVKLSDFGLATTDVHSSDMDCGSAPYMSYECRNNVGPTYATQPADIWSLGIVLINMLYHHNLWSDTSISSEDSSSSFDSYCANPVAFLLQRSPGLTVEVAEYLATKVFCLISPENVRVSAHEFGEWARSLPARMAASPFSVSPSPSSLDLQARTLSSHSDRDIEAVPRLTHSPDCLHRGEDEDKFDDHYDERSMSPVGFMTPAFTIVDSEAAPALGADSMCDACDVEMQRAGSEEDCSRTTSAIKRRKRGARKGKGGGVVPPVPATPVSPIWSPNVVAMPLAPIPDADHRLEDLAQGTQVLAREISRVSKMSASLSRSSSVVGFHPIVAAPSSISAAAMLHSLDPTPSPKADFAAPPQIVKKPSKWNISMFSRKEAGAAESPASSLAVGSTSASEAARNVGDILRSIDPQSEEPTATHSAYHSQTSSSSSNHESEASGPWRGRRDEPRWGPSTLGEGPIRPMVARGPNGHNSRERERWQDRSPAPSVNTIHSAQSANWRQPAGVSSASSSVYTRFSNGSERSLSTMATSVSATSNYMAARDVPQQQEKKRVPVSGPRPAAAPPASRPNKPRAPPSNVKPMQGIPWELDELPRHCRPRVNGRIPEGDIFGGPPVRRHKQQPPPLALHTISERPKVSPTLSSRPVHPSSLSRTSLPDSGEEDSNHQRKKVPKAQVNALAKMLSALGANRGRD